MKAGKPKPWRHPVLTTFLYKKKKSINFIREKWVKTRDWRGGKNPPIQKTGEIEKLKINLRGLNFKLQHGCPVSESIKWKTLYIHSKIRNHQLQTIQEETALLIQLFIMTEISNCTWDGYLKNWNQQVLIITALSNSTIINKCHATKFLETPLAARSNILNC